MKQDLKLDVTSLTQRLLAQKTTRDRFKFPCTREQAIDLLTAAYRAEVAFRRRQFIADEYTASHIAQLADFLTSDTSRFGLMLCGTYGNGKTTLMYALRSATNLLNRCGEFNERRVGIRIEDARDIAKLYTARDQRPYNEFKQAEHVIIEDMGKEPIEQMNYGTVISPVVEILEYRYHNQLFTAITTNLTPQEIRTKYGNRIADRFNEMMQVITFQDQTYRK